MQSVEAGGLEIGDGQPPRIMAVVNVSEESPVEGSVFTDPDAAATHIDEELIAAGADIIDIGLQSAEPQFDVLGAETEHDRLSLALETLEAVNGEAVFSIETRYADVAEAALEGGFAMINDVCGFADPRMPMVAADFDVPVVKMAGPGDLERPGALSSVEDIYDALARDPLPENAIIDPAFGNWCEAKTPDVDRELFERLGEFHGLGRPLLVSLDRKPFLQAFVRDQATDPWPASLAATAMAVERGVDVLRTHEVAATQEAAIVGKTLGRETYRDPELGIRELDIRGPGDLRRHADRLEASRAIAADGYTWAFQLEALAPVEVSVLEHLVVDCGGTLATGQDGNHLLLATHRELQRLHEAVEGESTPLQNVLERLVEVSA